MMITEPKVSSLAMAFGYRKEELERKITRPGLFPFVTISREAGTGGHELAEEIIRRLNLVKHKPLLQGWRVYDHEICRKVAGDSHLKVSLAELFDEEYHNLVDDLMLELIVGHSSQDLVMPKIFRTVYELASMGKAIIVGRGGSFLTREIPNGLHLRLIAPLEMRVERLMRELGVAKREALATLKRQDRDRARLVKRYFHQDITDPRQYDAVFNSGELAIPDIANVATRLVEMRHRDIRS